MGVCFSTGRLPGTPRGLMRPRHRSAADGQLTTLIFSHPVAPEFARYRLLQYRDLTPDDFDLLRQLDERVPRKGRAPASLVEHLPQQQAHDCGATECAICLCEFQPHDSVTKLPCSHAFCPPCIVTWLTEHRNECPLCLASIDRSPESQTPTRPPSEESERDAASSDLWSNICMDDFEEELDMSMPTLKPQIISVTRAAGVGSRG